MQKQDTLHHAVQGNPQGGHPGIRLAGRALPPPQVPAGTVRKGEQVCVRVFVFVGVPVLMRVYEKILS